MSDEPKREQAVQELITETELRKLNVEVQKTELECQELQKDMQQKWYLGPSLVKVIVAGLVVGAAIIAWFFSVGGSFMQHLSTLRALQKEELGLLERKATQTEVANELVRGDQKRLSARLADLSQRYKKLSEDYELAQSERTRFEQLHRELNEELSLQGLDVIISFDYTKDTVPWRAIKTALEDAGATTHPDALVPPIGEGMSIRYYSDEHQEKARLIQRIVGGQYGLLPIKKGRPSSKNVIEINLWPQ